MMLPDGFRRVPFAHRALHDMADGRPENSRAAIQAAIDAGYGIEIDVQLSADGAAMVFHDYALERLTGATGAVRLRTAGELGEIGLTGGAEGIPGLPEVLTLIAGRVPLLIEIKDQDGGMGPDVGPLEQAVARGLQDYDGEVAVMSFNPHSVGLMADLAPQVARGLVTSAYRYEDWPLPRATCDRLRDIPDFERTGSCFISHEYGDLSRPRVTELRAKGAYVSCWTVRSPQEASIALAAVDNITFEGFRPPAELSVAAR